MEKPTEIEAERTRGDVARVRRSLLIIFGVGGLGTALAIVYVMRHLPAGNVDAQSAAPLPVAGAPGVIRTSPPGCKKFGDSCEFRPGQRGACVQRENCTGTSCLFCQSQH